MNSYEVLNAIREIRVKRLYGWLNNIPRPPVKITMFTTQKCNLKCTFCGVPKCIEEGKFDFSRELPTEKWLDVVREGIELGVVDWEMLGVGEALLRPDVVVNTIKLIKENSKISYFLLTTNGTLFTKEIIREIVKYGLDRIQFSIDGPDSKTHDYLRGVKGTFKKAVWALKNITKMKRKLKTENPALSINMVLNAKNYNKVDKMIKLAHKVGVEEIIITPMRVEKDNAERIEKYKLIMDNNEIEKFYELTEKYRKLAEKNKIRLQILLTKGKEKIIGPTDDIIEDNIQNKFLTSPCYEPFYNLAITPTGEVGPCVTSASFGIKNLNVMQRSLKDIWYSKEFNEIREKRINRIPLPQCSHCTITELRKQIRNELLEYLKEKNEYERFVVKK
jgi:radical SAM protein with 4Fe4S-binding SPASM domain